MLVLNEWSPKTSLYYLGGKLLQFLKDGGIKKIRLCDLYERFSEENRVAFNRFILVVDWLFVIGKITLTSTGALKCI